jgi:hypothetical protein
VYGDRLGPRLPAQKRNHGGGIKHNITHASPPPFDPR